MKTRMTYKIVALALIACVLIIFGEKVFAAGLLTPKDGSMQPLKMKDHHVNVMVEDGYVITQVDQVFANPHNMDLEALYTFPVPENASVAEFSLWIDGQKVTGEVLEKKQAKKIYEEEKAAGRDAGLTEKTKAHSFEIRVYPIRAMDKTRLRLVYFQPVTMDTGMGRYVYPLESGGTDDQQMNFWTANEQVEESFSFDFKLRSAIPVDGIRVPGFPQAAVKKIDPQQWQVNLANNLQSNGTGEQEENALPNNSPNQPGFKLNKDIVVYWRQVPGIPGSVELITYKPGNSDKGTFMITVSPGDDLKKITEGRDWIFILDKSGSMDGKFHTLLEGVEKALGKMNAKDRFRIIFFNDNADEFTNGYVNATAENVKKAVQALKAEGSSGGTNLYEGLEMAMKMTAADRTTSLILVTDGVANVGVTEQAEFIKLVKGKDTRLFTFIMGNNANTFLLKHLTTVSNGFAAAVSNSDDIVGQILLATSKSTHEALHDAKLTISGVKTSELTSNNNNSLYRGQQLIVFGHYRGEGPAKIKLTGKISGQEKIYETEFSFPGKSQQHPEIERLWAYSRIQEMKRGMMLNPHKNESKQAIIDLSKQYGIVTDYTSMLVVRNDVFEKKGIERSNKKRLENENKAQQARSQSQVQSRRVDNSTPMFRSNQPTFSGSGGGSGALNLWFLVFLAPLAMVKIIKRKN